MPTYQYACEKCGHEFEIFQSMKDEALAMCPKDRCGQQRWGKGKVKRLVGAGAGLIFKGSGFYITDYRSESYKAAAKSDASSSGGGSAASPAPASPAPAKKDGAGSGSGAKPASPAPAAAKPSKPSKAA